MEDIRNNPDVKGKDLNEILFQRYGLYMKQSTLYKMKQYVINEIFGGHDKSYGKLPAYVKVIHETNPGSAAFCALTDIGHPQRSSQFSSIVISFATQFKGFIGGCRFLIGVDGTHLKGNYGGILLSAIALDGNNEIFPVAYAIVSAEDTQNWSFFFWHLYNLVNDSGRTDWTIISDRQKVRAWLRQSLKIAEMISTSRAFSVRMLHKIPFRKGNGPTNATHRYAVMYRLF